MKSMNFGEDAIMFLIDAGADVNAQNNSGITALMMDAKEPKSIEMLTENGGDVNIFDDEGKTALMYAASRGKQDIVEMLFNDGAEIDYADMAEKTALAYSVADSIQKKVIQILIEYGAEVNVSFEKKYGSRDFILLHL